MSFDVSIQNKGFRMDKTKENLEYIYSYYEDMYGPGAKDEAVEMSKFLSGNISYHGRSWTWRYFLSLRNETMKPSRWAIKAIAIHAKKLKKLTKKPRRKPLDTEIAKRTLVIYATLDELHEIQKRYAPRDRAIRLLGE